LAFQPGGCFFLTGHGGGTGGGAFVILVTMERVLKAGGDGTDGGPGLGLNEDNEGVVLGFPAVKVTEKRLYVQNEKDEKFVKVTKRDNK